MRVVSADELTQTLAFPPLIEALREAFGGGIVAPPRHHHTIERPGEPAATLLLMPAWTHPALPAPRYIGVKIASVFPGNAARGMSSVAATYLLLDGESGAPLAAIDGLELTLWRTAAASALAASFLAREDASRLVMVGAGNLAPYLIAAHAAVRPIREVLIWNRTSARAEAVAASLAGLDYSVRAATDLEAAVRNAGIISCATLSSAPLVHGAWLKPGSHLDLVGAFTPEMRESDDEAVRRARVFVDTREGALKEAGDIVQPIAAGGIGESDIVGDLFDLCGGAVEGRRSGEEITLFKSVGAALEGSGRGGALFQPAASGWESLVTPRWKTAVRALGGENRPATLTTLRIAGAMSSLFRSPLAEPPAPWLNPDNGIMVVWSAKAACSTVFVWFLHTLGLAEDFRASGKRAHAYRAQDYYPSDLYRRGRSKPVDDYFVLHIIRDPHLRAVSSYRHALITGYADKRLPLLPVGPLAGPTGFSFSQFLDYLETIDITRANIHHKLQLHPVEKLKKADRVINISRSDLFAELNRLELDLGLTKTDFAAMDWLHEIENRRAAKTKSYEAADIANIAFDSAAARGKGAWPTYEQFLSEHARRRIEKIYAPDFEAFSAWL